MSAKTNVQKDATLNTMRGTAAAAWTPYVALYTTAPADDLTGGVEVAGGAYARQVYGPGAPTTNGIYREVANAAAVTFPLATADWGTIAAVGLVDALTGGSPRYVFAVTVSKPVLNGDTPSFGIGVLVTREA